MSYVRRAGKIILGQRIPFDRRKVFYDVLIATGAFVLLGAAYAQYTFDPANADELPGIRYFGSAKDENGVLLANVTVLVTFGDKTDFVFITDEQGRFRGILPQALGGAGIGKISPTCSKKGYQFLRSTNRVGVDAPKPYVQVDCVLRALMVRASAVSSAPAASIANEAGARKRDLEMARQSEDFKFQRRHAWMVIAELTRTRHNHSAPSFEAWYGEDQVFGSDAAAKLPKGIRGFSRRAPQGVPADSEPFQTGEAPVLTYTLYNEAAYRHIRRYRLYKSSELQSLQTAGTADVSVPADHSVPAFPSEAIVLKTVWWPVANKGATPLPVWDPELNPPRRSGNGYLTWQRVVAIHPSAAPSDEPVQRIEFAGRAFVAPRRVNMQEFYHVMVDAPMAKRAMRDPQTRKAAAIALGREIKKGDYLILVAANLATKELDEWVWATFWWHDKADQGPFAQDRPAALKLEWRNYLMQVAFDSDKPAAFDGGPHICFNPWLEGRFPNAGLGGGTVSNCLACHRRASFPAPSFLPVTRGQPDYARDPAFAAGRVRTSLLWSLAMHSSP